MLITNFAAGELSENLFGRTDLPQYYAGVSRLENFDVIPTGGIERRAGTERLLALPEAGRLIPFTVDRLNHFLLYLMPGKIAVIKNGIIQQTIENSAALPLYASLPEIREVQYAQNFDTMILAHEHYKPLMAKYHNNTIYISPLTIRYDVEIKAAGDIDTSPFFELDETYKDANYLKSPGNYPRAVTFFNGRLVFAGTKNDPQRVFASRVNDYTNFTTYKKFLTEKREYVIIRGTINENTDTITFSNKETPLSFTRDLASYIAETTFYPPDTRILEMYADTIRLSKLSIIRPPMNGQEKNELEEWKNNADSWWNNPETKETAFRIGRPWKEYNGNNTMYDYLFRMYPGINKVKVMAGDITREYSITKEMAEYLRNASTAPPLYRYYLEEYFKPKLDGIADELIRGAYFGQAGDAQEYYDALYSLYLNAFSFTEYHVRDKYFYGWPLEIYHDVKEYFSQGNDVYIPFYTSEILVDRHPTPDDGFTFEIASDMSDAIRWLVLNKGIIIGTETAEWIIPPGVTAANVYAALNSQYGSDTIQGTVINDAACFFQTGKKALVEYYIPQQDNNFRANNMALLSPAMLGESPALEFDFIRAPYSKLFITREDGAAVTLLYERSTGTFAWGRITTAGGIRSVAVLPGADGNDDVYLAVERGGAYFLETLREAGAVYLDSFERWTGTNQDYSDDALVLDGATGAARPKPLAPAPAEDAVMWIGYPYVSRARSMPVLANNRMKPNNIKTLLVRFLDSFMPTIKSLPNGATDTIPRKEPFSGVTGVPFPGVWDTDVMFEFIHDKPAGCKILAISAEVN